MENSLLKQKKHYRQKFLEKKTEVEKIQRKLLDKLIDEEDFENALSLINEAGINIDSI